MSGKHTALGTLLLAAACGLGIGACAPDERNDVEPEGYLAGAEGARLYYRVMGDGSDTVVVHGGPGAGSNSVRPDFEPLAERLGRRGSHAGPPRRASTRPCRGGPVICWGPFSTERRPIPRRPVANGRR